jgi:zeaxanthin glucosyltransferase
VPTETIQARGYLDSTVAFGRICFEKLQVDSEFLVIDQLFPSGATVAQHLNIPYVTFPSPTGISVDLQPWTDLENGYRKTWDLPVYENVLTDSVSKLAHLVEWPKSFDPKRPPAFNVGPMPTTNDPFAFPWERLTGQPLVYATLGTMMDAKPIVYRTIMEALEKLDLQVVLTLGGSTLTFDRVPENVILVKFAPQFELLQRSTLCISNAGHNCTLECLSLGVPMVAIPIGHDQPATAARIRQTRTGKTLKLSELSRIGLRAAVLEVLNNPAYRRNVQAMKAEIDQLDSLETACNIICERL